MGLSPRPISRREIFREWHKIHSPKIRKKYIYDLVKNLYVEGFLTFIYNPRKNSQTEELLNPTKGELIVTGSVPWDEEMKRAMVNSDGEMNWEYELTLKGLLLYLISTICHNDTTKKERKKLAQHKIIKTKTINEVIINVSKISDKKQDLTFLKFFQVIGEIYDTKTKVDIILQIAKELNNLVSEMTFEFLRNYVINRCYDEVIIKIGEIEKDQRNYSFMNKMLKVGGRLSAQDVEIADAETVRSDMDLKKLKQYKKKILNELIPITIDRLISMKEDWKATQQEIIS